MRKKGQVMWIHRPPSSSQVWYETVKGEKEKIHKGKKWLTVRMKRNAEVIPSAPYNGSCRKKKKILGQRLEKSREQRWRDRRLL